MQRRGWVKVIANNGVPALIVLVLIGPVLLPGIQRLLGIEGQDDPLRAPSGTYSNPLLRGLSDLDPFAVTYALTPAYNPMISPAISCRIADSLDASQPLWMVERFRRRCEADTRVGSVVERNLRAILAEGAWPAQHYSFEAIKLGAEEEVFTTGPFTTATECASIAAAAREGDYLTNRCRHIEGIGGELTKFGRSGAAR